jgi:hypothetical protein
LQAVFESFQQAVVSRNPYLLPAFQTDPVIQLEGHFSRLDFVEGFGNAKVWNRRVRDIIRNHVPSMSQKYFRIYVLGGGSNPVRCKKRNDLKLNPQLEA